ncbi:MAG: hypothetical protein ABI689_14035, partial [Thermoanaerobaculia bacterium]
VASLTSRNIVPFFMQVALDGATVIRTSPKALKAGSEVPSFQVKARSLGSAPWTFAGVEEGDLIAALRRSRMTFGSISQISRGSSSGADEVFILEQEGLGLRSRDGEFHSAEAESLRVPIFASDFRRYEFAPRSVARIVFPYEVHDPGYKLLGEKELKGRFPKCYRYLTSKRKELEARKQYSEWYSFSAPRNLGLHERADFLVPLLANQGSFCLLPTSTRQFCLMASGGFSISLSATERSTRLALLGVLNSKVVFWFLRQISNRFRGGWITCTKQYVEQIPLPGLADSRASALSSLVQYLLSATLTVSSATTPHEGAAARSRATALEDEIDRLVYELYELTPEEIAIVERG